MFPFIRTFSSPGRNVMRLSAVFFPALVLCAFLFCLFASLPARAASPPLAELRGMLAKEQKKAAERKQSLKRLTERERKLNSDLAVAEKRVLELERGLSTHQTKLLELGSADDKARREYEALLAEQAKTEQAQTETLRLLWEITGRNIVVGSRNMLDWAQTDREYAWSRELYAALEKYRLLLDRQEAKLVEGRGRRDKLSRDMQKRMAAVSNEKNQLLKARLDYDRQLADLRKKRGSTEAELNDILRLVDSLNLEITRRAGGDIASMKGKLPWPVNGKVRLRYAPQAVPASRGLGFSAPERAEVRAVAGGKVVHNDILRGFGTVLIMQHGEDYYTLYAFLGSSPLRVGQEVASREKIGTVGLYPVLQGPGLYFELRFKQKAINPEQWFAS